MKIFDFFKKLFHTEDEEDEFDWYDEHADEQTADPILFTKGKLNLNDANQMERYVVSCCEQMKEADNEIEKASSEYRLVTEYLKDMENLNLIDELEWLSIENIAQTIANSGKQMRLAKERTDVMDEDKYRHMQRYEADIPDAINDMKSNEDFKSIVREDLKNLEGEKVSYRFRDRELKATMKGAREVTVIVIMAVFFIVMILAFLQFALNYEVSIGYFCTIAGAAIALTLLFLRYNKAKVEDRKVVRLLKEAISAQNAVKIRYVNITSLIDYQYTKYKVNSSNELRYMWDKYLKEKKERDAIRKATEELEGSRASLVKELSAAGLKYPEIWLNQADALLDERELREIRHELVVRRQGLRKRVDYNEQVRKIASDEVKSLIGDYPKHADLIIDIVGRYE